MATTQRRVNIAVKVAFYSVVGYLAVLAMILFLQFSIHPQ
jgi:hypothetical protein